MSRFVAAACAIAFAAPSAGWCGPNSSAANIGLCTLGGRVVEECLEHMEAFDAATDPSERASHLQQALEALIRKPKPPAPPQPAIEKPPTMDYCGRPDQSAALMRFASANVNRFPSELKEPAGVLTLIADEENYPVRSWGFDDSRGVAHAYNLPITDHLVLQHCKAAGSFDGVNGMGVKRRVQRRNCIRLEIKDEWSTLSLPNDIAMTPTRFREIKTLGYKLAFAFAVGEGVRQEVATRNLWHEKATVQYPVESDTVRLVVNGAIKQICMISAKDGVRLADIRAE